MDLHGKRALVTGGAGFIPSTIVDELLRRGAQVRVLDDLSDGREENLAGVRGRVDFRRGDIRDFETVRAAVAEQQLIFHLAANANVPRSVKEPLVDFAINANGTANILEAARLAGGKVERILFASSAAVYGAPVRTPMDEAHPLHPISPYGASKLAGERLGFAYRSAYGTPFTAMRIFNTYGPRQPRYVIHDLFRKLQQNPHRLEVLGTGEQVRDYSFVADTARAFVDAAADPRTEGEALNIAGGRPISIRDLVKMILQTLRLSDTQVTYTGQSWPGDIATLSGDIRKIKGFGFAPTTSLEEGLSQFAAWIADRPVPADFSAPKTS